MGHCWRAFGTRANCRTLLDSNFVLVVFSVRNRILLLGIEARLLDRTESLTGHSGSPSGALSSAASADGADMVDSAQHNDLSSLNFFTMIHFISYLEEYIYTYCVFVVFSNTSISTTRAHCGYEYEKLPKKQ